jgi:hypothetical protein
MICDRQIAENATKLHTASNMSTTAIHIMTFRPSFSCRALYAARRALFLLLIVLSVLFCYRIFIHCMPSAACTHPNGTAPLTVHCK